MRFDTFQSGIYSKEICYFGTGVFIVGYLTKAVRLRFPNLSSDHIWIVDEVDTSKR
jgi:hypothetical protein